MTLTQRLRPHLGGWACAGCHAELRNGMITHPDTCPELGPVIRLLTDIATVLRAVEHIPATFHAEPAFMRLATLVTGAEVAEERGPDAGIQPGRNGGHRRPGGPPGR